MKIPLCLKLHISMNVLNPSRRRLPFLAATVFCVFWAGQGSIVVAAPRASKPVHSAKVPVPAEDSEASIMKQVEEVRRLISRNEAILRRPQIYKPVANALALYCQSPKSYWPDRLDSAWLPASLEAVGHGWGSLYDDSAHYELGGGFYHYGYLLTRDKAKSTRQTNFWQLKLYREEAKEELLYSFVLPKAKRHTEASLIQVVSAGYDRQIAASLRASRTSPEEDDERDYQRPYEEKISLLLRFNRGSQARQVCTQMLAQKPDDWWAQLLNALIRARQMPAAQAEKPLLQWVKRNPNFFSYLDLAYYYQLQRQPVKAAQAMYKATSFNANTPWGHGGNAEFRGYSAAIYAAQSGQEGTAMELCDKLLKVTINGNYAKSALRKLHAVARQRVMYKRVQPVTFDPDMLPFEPFEHIDLKRLLPSSSGTRRAAHR